MVSNKEMQLTRPVQIAASQLISSVRRTRWYKVNEWPERVGRLAEVEGRRERVVELCGQLPETEVERAGPQHLAFKVKKKILGYYLNDHHGDGKVAVWCKAPPGEQSRLVEEDPAVHFVSAYVGPKGWLGIRLDTPRVGWARVKEHLLAAWFLTAPASLRKRVQPHESTEPAAGRRRRTRGIWTPPVK